MRGGDGAAPVRAPGRAVRAVPLVAGEVAAEEFLGAAGVGVAARQRDPLLQQPLGEHEATVAAERGAADGAHLDLRPAVAADEVAAQALGKNSNWIF